MYTRCTCGQCMATEMHRARPALSVQRLLHVDLASLSDKEGRALLRMCWVWQRVPQLQAEPRHLPPSPSHTRAFQIFPLDKLGLGFQGSTQGEPGVRGPSAEHLLLAKRRGAAFTSRQHPSCGVHGLREPPRSPNDCDFSLGTPAQRLQLRGSLLESAETD